VTGGLSNKILILSQQEPDWGRLNKNWVSKIDGTTPIDTKIQSICTGFRSDFRIRVNPNRRSVKVGKRVAILGPMEQACWLEQQAQKNGFQIDSLEATPNNKLQFKRVTGDEIVLNSVLFTGTLTVTDQDKFRKVLVNGIGPGKGFGLGLLSVRL